LADQIINLSIGNLKFDAIQLDLISRTIDAVVNIIGDILIVELQLDIEASLVLIDGLEISLDKMQSAEEFLLSVYLNTSVSDVLLSSNSAAVSAGIDLMKLVDELEKYLLDIGKYSIYINNYYSFRDQIIEIH
jgi:hypothetical protein